MEFDPDKKNEFTKQSLWKRILMKQRFMFYPDWMEKIKVSSDQIPASVTHDEAFLLLKQMQIEEETPDIKVSTVETICTNAVAEVSATVTIMDSQITSINNGRVSVHGVNCDMDQSIIFFVDTILDDNFRDKLELFKVMFNLSDAESTLLDASVSQGRMMVLYLARKLLQDKTGTVGRMMRICLGEIEPCGPLEEKFEEIYGVRYVEAMNYDRVVDDNALEEEIWEDLDNRNSFNFSNIYVLSDVQSDDKIGTVKDIVNFVDHNKLDAIVMDCHYDNWIVASVAMRCAVLLPDIINLSNYKGKGVGLFNLADGDYFKYVRFVHTVDKTKLTLSQINRMGKRFFSIVDIQPTTLKVYPSARVRNKMVVTDMGRKSYRISDLKKRACSYVAHLRNTMYGGESFALKDIKYKYMQWFFAVRLARIKNDYISQFVQYDKGLGYREYVPFPV